MKEVSCRAFEIFMRPLEERRIPLERVLVGTGLSPRTVRDKNERVDWTAFLQIHHNLTAYFSDDELVEMGRQHLRGPLLRYAFVVARLRFTPLEFYGWFNRPKKGVGNQLFTCIVPTQRELSDHELEVDLEVAEGYEVCPEFFLITRGNFEEMPRLLGLPPAKVQLTRLPRGGRFRITLPQHTPLFAHARRALAWPFAIRQAGRELQDAHETLQTRYEQLEEARARLDRQAAHLRTAHTINELIQRDLDLARTVDTIVRALVEAGFAYAELALTADGRSARAGERGDAAPITRTLEARGGQAIAELVVVVAVGEDREDRETLLALIVPAIAIGIENAIYRSDLERLVDERTTELRLARDQLAGTVDQLRQAQGARERFFGNISHEIRTPLSLIMLAASDIETRAGAALDPRARGGLGAITDGSRKLVRLVDELLLLAAGQEGKLRAYPEPTDVVALLEQLANAWRPACEAAGLDLAVALPAALSANVDPVGLERVATNLMSNAVKYTPHGGRIELELAVEPDGVRVSVLDTGAGIAPELEARLFGRFERSEGDDRRKAGTGLGLALAKQLVEAHGGTIRAIARVPRGSELRVMLPSSVILREPSVSVPRTLRLVEEAPASALPAGTRLAPRGLSMGTILLAEDDIRLAEQIARLLADEYTVVIAHDGLQALELVRAHQPQMLIADVDMPGLDGIELARRFRDATGDRLAPIVIVSAVLDLGTRVAGLEAGAVDYVTKPFDPVELLARVRAQFRMRDLAVRLHRAEQLSTLGILTSGLAHELRNPANGVVNAIGPLVDLLPRELKQPDQPVGELLDVIGSCAQQIAFLSRQLLGFRNSGIDLELRPANLSELVQRAVSLAQGALNGVELRSHLDAEGVLLCAPPLVTQVLTNLIENAGYAAGRGGWIDVRTHEEPQGGSVTVEVGDSGPGIPVELRERIFEPFFTTKPAGVGTGLGLSVAREIVQRHNGTLDVRERDSRHVFVIRLPNYTVRDALARADAG